MTKKIAPLAETELKLGRRVTREVSVLLTEIQNEPVPDRLLELARELQEALNQKLD
jgi:hypothetical protein